MAICINCHTLTKGFFAPRCSECNEECGFIVQVFSSLLYVAVQLAAWYIMIRLIFYFFYY